MKAARKFTGHQLGRFYMDIFTTQMHAVFSGLQVQLLISVRLIRFKIGEMNFYFDLSLLKNSIDIFIRFPPVVAVMAHKGSQSGNNKVNREKK
jgi:hypothetical protein